MSETVSQAQETPCLHEAFSVFGERTYMSK